MVAVVHTKTAITLIIRCETMMGSSNASLRADLCHSYADNIGKSDDRKDIQAEIIIIEIVERDLKSAPFIHP